MRLSKSKQIFSNQTRVKGEPIVYLFVEVEVLNGHHPLLRLWMVVALLI